MLSLKLRVWIFFFKQLLDKGLKNFYTKFQVNILKHTVAITEKHDRQSSLLHPVFWTGETFEIVISFISLKKSRISAWCRRAALFNSAWMEQETDSSIYDTFLTKNTFFLFVSFCSLTRSVFRNMSWWNFWNRLFDHFSKKYQNKFLTNWKRGCMLYDYLNLLRIKWQIKSLWLTFLILVELGCWL